MNGGLRFILGVCICGVVLLIAWKIFDPAPIPAGAAMVGGLLGLLVARRRWMRDAVIGTFIGLLCGMSLHAWSHIPKAGPSRAVSFSSTSRLMPCLALPSARLA